jgi:RHS repeat-associated protein
LRAVRKSGGVRGVEAIMGTSHGSFGRRALTFLLALAMVVSTSCAGWPVAGVSAAHAATAVAAVQGVCATTTAGPWCAESDANGDGLSDSQSATLGTGTVTLSWDPIASATSYALYLFTGYCWQGIGTTSVPSWSSAGKYLYPSAAKIASLPASYTGYMFTRGAGTDLRDDPTSLYAKTAGSSVDCVPAYFFKVTAIGPVGEGPLSDAATVTVQMASRTKSANEDVAHTTFSLGDAAGDQATAELDGGVLTLDATDLVIDSYGPQATLTRTYRSDVASSTCFGPGWRFGFEQSVTTGAAGSRIFTDARGEQHRFLPSAANAWTAPHTMVASLTYDPSGATYALALKGGTTLTFDGSGRLAKETDRRGVCVRYTWNADRSRLTIQAANLRTIEVCFSGGRITRAESCGITSDRCVEYPTATSVVTHPALEQERRVEYSYADSKLVRVAVPGFAPGGVPAIWDASYSSSGAFDALALPHPASAPARWMRVTTDQIARTADVQRPSRVGTSCADTTVTETFAWDPMGREVANGTPAVSPQSRAGTATSDYAPSGAPRRTVSAAGVVASSITDARRNVLYVSDSQGRTTTNAYSATDDLVRSVGPNGAVMTRTYSPWGDVWLERDTLNASQSSETSCTYDAYGRLWSRGQLIDASGARAYTTYRYGNKTEEPVQKIDYGVVPCATSTVDLVTTQGLDEWGEVASATDALGNVVSSTTYDLSGRVVTETDAAGVVTHHAYDLLGAEVETSRTSGSNWADRTTRVVDPTGLVLSESSYVTSGGAVVAYQTVDHVYDGSGQEIKSFASDEGTTTVAFDAKGDVSAQWDPEDGGSAAGAGLSIVSDADGRQVSERDGTGTPEVTTYVPGSDDVASVDPAGAAATVFGYDAADNQVAQAVPVPGGGSVTETSTYDLAGRETSCQDASGNVATTTYDLLGRAIATRLDAPDGTRTTVTSYNSLGWVLATTDAGGVVTRHTYDADGRAVSDVVACPDGSTATTLHAFDAAGNETRTVAPDGSEVRTTFDAFGREVARIELVGGAIVHSVVTKYDNAGREVASSDTVGGTSDSVAFATSASGDAVTSRRVGDATVTVTESAEGTEAARALAVPGAPPISFVTRQRDSEQRQVAACGPSGPSAWTWDGAGRLAAQSGPGLVATYAYDGASGLEAAERQSVDGLASQATTLTLRYTVEGRLASESRGTSSTAYSYDAAGRILSAGATRFAYRGEQLTTATAGVSPTTYRYDTRGRRVQSTSSDASATYGWNASDQLTTFRLDRGRDGSVEVSASFGYDAAGQRTRSVVASAGAITTCTFTYCDLRLDRVVSASGSVVTTLTYLCDENDRPVGLVASVSGYPSPFAVGLATDARGDVVAMTDPSGRALASWAYDAYGNTIGTGGSATAIPVAAAARIVAAQPLRYAGYALDPCSGLYYCSQRYYDPQVRQFVTRDPALSDAEESAYQYCAGNPVGNSDPSGLEPHGYGYADGTGSYDHIAWTGRVTWQTPGWKLTEAGRLRRYGASARVVRSRLVTIKWLGKRIKVHKLARRQFEAVAKDIRNHSTWRPRVVYTYLWRHIGWDPRRPLSNHSFGIAIDIDPAQNPQSSRLRTNLPKVVVKAFERQGARWGGRYVHALKDAMHFEF